MNPAYVALGSNLDDPAAQLRRAIRALRDLPQTRLRRASSIYRSRAVGPPGQPDDLHAAALLHTARSPHQLLDALQDIERRQGRARDVRWGPRTLDLDLLLFAQQVLQDERLSLPHPRLAERDFVLYPLREISDTNLVLPDGRDIESLARACPGNSLVNTGCRLNTD